MTKSKPMTFADDLRAWRERFGLTQAEAAEALSVPLRTLQEWEQGRAAPAPSGPVRRLMELHKTPAAKVK